MLSRARRFAGLDVLGFGIVPFMVVIAARPRWLGRPECSSPPNGGSRRIPPERPRPTSPASHHKHWQPCAHALSLLAIVWNGLPSLFRRADELSPLSWLRPC
jgi:hypothetical protein